jgi:hypothetical protein
MSCPAEKAANAYSLALIATSDAIERVPPPAEPFAG